MTDPLHPILSFHEGWNQTHMVLIIGFFYMIRTFVYDMLERLLNRILKCCGQRRNIDEILFTEDNNNDGEDLVATKIMKP